MRSLTLRDLEDLGWKRFEDLVAAIVLKEHPDAEQLSGKDGGADTLLERREQGSKVWQAKHYPREVHWNSCVESLDSAIENHGATEVVFVFPRNMSYPIKKTFKKRLASRHPDVEVSYMSGSQLINRLRERQDDLVEEFFGPEPGDQAQAIAEHLAAQGMRVSPRAEADEIGQRLALADEAGRRDRYFRTEIAVATGDTPLPKWTERPALLVTSADGDRELRIAAWPEKGVDAQPLELQFDDSEDGHDARWEIARMLASKGKVKLPKGTTAQLSQVPEAIKALVKPGSGSIESAVVFTIQSHPARLIGEHEGEQIEREMTLVAVPPLETTDAPTAAFGGVDGALSLFLDFSYGKKKVEIGIRLGLDLTDTNGLEVVAAALRLMVAFDEGNGRIEAPSLHGNPICPGRSGSERTTHNLSSLRFVQNLIEIRNALDLGSFDLSTEFTGEESRDVATAAHIIRSRQGYFEFTTLGVDVPSEEVTALEHNDFKSVVMRFPCRMEILGQKVFLGIGEGELPQPTEAKIVKAFRSGRRRVELKWDDPLPSPFRLVSEIGDYRPETGLWVVGRVPEAPELNT